MIFLEHWNNKALHSEKLEDTRMKAVSAPSIHPQSLKTSQNTPPHFVQETVLRLHHEQGIQEIAEQRNPLPQLLEVFQHPKPSLCLSASHQESREPTAVLCQLNPCNVQQKSLQVQISLGCGELCCNWGNSGSLIFMDSGCLSWFNHIKVPHRHSHPTPPWRDRKENQGKKLKSMGWDNNGLILELKF